MKLGKYKHYKGGLYEVIGKAHHSESLEKLVIYRALYKTPEYEEGTIWARPEDMFNGKVLVDEREVPRFEYIEEA